MNQKADQDKNRKDAPKDQYYEAKIRGYLALGITIVPILSILILGIMVINSDKSKGQTVFNAVLPIFGAWVSTVLAYFFSRENFESASRSVERMAKYLTSQEKLESTPVSSVMIRRDMMVVCDDPPNTILMDISAQLENKDLQRLPILDKTGVPIALLYLTDIMNYLYKDKSTISEDDRKKLTVENLLAEKPNYKKCFVIIAENQTLADAQKELSKIPDSRVVLVTKGGRLTDPVVGLLTLLDIVRNAQV
jgi:hypothetical protein